MFLLQKTFLYAIINTVKDEKVEREKKIRTVPPEETVMEKEIKRSIQIICSLLLGSREPSLMPFEPQKTAAPAISPRYFKRSSPTKHGVSLGRIQNFLSELESNTACNIHSVMILKDSEVICEAYAPGFERGLVHLSHSMSKTVTGIAVAILLDEEKLDTDTTVSEIFTEFKLSGSVASVTVSDLITMSSGLSFSELGAITSTDWTEDFLYSKQKFEGGEGFSYNSMNSYILARIVERVSGTSFEDFLNQKLFEPLKITSYFWEKGPEGTVKGGWGLYLSLEDWLKIASIFIWGGKFENKTIVSHMSIFNLLMTRNEHSAEKDRDFDYAGHLNLSKSTPAILLNGLFGQNIYIDPAQKIAVAVNSGNNELFKASATLDIILKYFPPEMNDKRLGLFASWRAHRALSKQERHFFESRSFVRVRKNKGLLEQLKLRSAEFPHEWNDILGKYLLPMNNIDLLPLIVRLMQNNTKGGIDTLEIVRVGSIPHLRLCTGEAVRDIPIGIYSHAECTVSFGGELYRIRTLGGVSEKNGVKEYKIEFVFPELPNTRTLVIKKLPRSAVWLEFNEMPSADAIAPLVEKLATSSTMGALAVGMIERKLGEGFIYRKLNDLFAPTFTAPLEKSKDVEEILSEENSRIEKEREQILAVPFISNFIRTEIRTIDGEEPKRRKSFFGLISGIFRSRQKKKADYISDSDDEDALSLTNDEE